MAAMEPSHPWQPWSCNSQFISKHVCTEKIRPVKGLSLADSSQIILFGFYFKPFHISIPLILGILFLEPAKYVVFITASSVFMESKVC